MKVQPDAQIYGLGIQKEYSKITGKGNILTIRGLKNPADQKKKVFLKMRSLDRRTQSYAVLAYISCGICVRTAVVQI